MCLTFGVDYIVTLLPAFLARCRNIRPDCSSRRGRSNFITEDFDAAIGGGIELGSGYRLAFAGAFAPCRCWIGGLPPEPDACRSPGFASFEGIVCRLVAHWTNTRTAHAQRRRRRADVPAPAHSNANDQSGAA
jgi:hypothetical protein